MKRFMLLASLIIAVGVFAACEEEEPFNFDGLTDVTHDDGTTPDTTPDITTDLPPDITTDVPVDTPVDTPPDTPIEIIPDGTGDAYGLINASFSTTFIWNGDMLNDDAYFTAHQDSISATPAFTGTYGSGKTIPGATATLNMALAAHIPAEGTNPAIVAVLQQSAADTSGTTANPWVELDFTTDAISPGNYTVGIMAESQAILVVINYLGPSSICMLAFAEGTINVSAASNTTATDGGSITLSGSSLSIYHPSNTPYGDITADLTSAGYQVCPIE
jgi:hypothetical protein